MCLLCLRGSQNHQDPLQPHQSSLFFEVKEKLKNHLVPSSDHPQSLARTKYPHFHLATNHYRCVRAYIVSLAIH
jgi:hypothetical protein